MIVPSCEPGNHVWTVVGEGADPELWQVCECGTRTWREVVLRNLYNSQSIPPLPFIGWNVPAPEFDPDVVDGARG